MANRIFIIFLKMQFEGHRGLQPVCTIIYTIKKIKKKNRTLTERERDSMICASRVHIFNLCAKRQKKKVRLHTNARKQGYKL